MNIMEIFSRMLLESWKTVYYKIDTKASAKREEIICTPYTGWIGQYTDKVDNDNETLEQLLSLGGAEPLWLRCFEHRL